jgi:hypothetical protein
MGSDGSFEGRLEPKESGRYPVPKSGLFVFHQALTGEQWANIAVAGVTWLLIP